jgi:glutaconate CoA-transferase subunit B
MATDGGPGYTRAELMVTAAAHEVRDGEVVFVGMRLPLLGFELAKRSHAPGAIGVYETGIVRDTPAPARLYTMGDLPNIYQAQYLADTLDMMSLLQSGRVDLSFIGGAQVDRHGNLNTSYIGPAARPTTRLPGSGGACDLASLAGRTIIVMAHERRRFVERVDYITSPGFGDGPGWRARAGLPRGGPAAVITTLGVLRFDPERAEMMLASLHPGVSVADVQANTGWPLRVAPELAETPAPTAAELAILRELDPDGFWTRADETEASRR